MRFPNRTAAIADPAAGSLPRAVRESELAAIPALPEPFRRLAQHQLRDPRTTSDHLLIMADGLAEAAEAAAMEGMVALGASLRILAAGLRGLAPLYGPSGIRETRP